MSWSDNDVRSPVAGNPSLLLLRWMLGLAFSNRVVRVRWVRTYYFCFLVLKGFGDDGTWMSSSSLNTLLNEFILADRVMVFLGIL